MKFEDILAMWESDSQIDKTDLAAESLKTPRLHHKYYTLYIAERSKLHRLESQMKTLKLEKYEFYTQGHTDETRARGWRLPAKGLILKGDIPMYIDADQDIIDLSLKIGIQQEKTHFLASVIDSLKARGFAIKNAIDFIRFTMGA